MSSLKKQVASNVMWSAIERFSVQGIQYVISIIIARILLPSDYGIIAMLGIFIAVFQALIDGGFANALIQKKECNQADFSTVFYFNIAISVLMYAILYLCSPFIASFYNVPQLDSVTKVIGLIMIINGFGIIQQARMTIALDFKRQAVASLAAVILSGIVGISMAYDGYGVWALVWHTLLNGALRVAIMWVMSRWKPSLVFSMSSFKSLFAFGSKLMASSLLHTIYTHIYTLIIGKKFAEVELGYFNRASTLAQFPSTNFTNVIVRAVYPIQCKMQDDEQKLNSTFFVYLRMACYIIFPIMIGLCVTAEPMIEVILKEKWLPAAPLFQILCIAYMWDPVMKINHNMLNVKGRSDYFLRAEIVKKTLAVIILISTIPFGVKVMCLGLILYSFADMLVIAYYTHKATKITLWQQIKALMPVILLSFSMGTVSYLSMLPFDSVAIKFTIGIISGIIFYVAASYLFRFKEFSHLISIVKRK